MRDFGLLFGGYHVMILTMAILEDRAKFAYPRSRLRIVHIEAFSMFGVLLPPHV
jgi:hypothetical protein